MTLAIPDEELPIQIDIDGVARVGGTRVTLETIVQAFSEGATAEEIVQQYPSLGLADVYSVIGFYLRKREDVDACMQERATSAAAVRKENESRFDPRGIRARLMNRSRIAE